MARGCCEIEGVSKIILPTGGRSVAVYEGGKWPFTAVWLPLPVKTGKDECAGHPSEVAIIGTDKLHVRSSCIYGRLGEKEGKGGGGGGR